MADALQTPNFRSRTQSGRPHPRSCYAAVNCQIDWILHACQGFPTELYLYERS